MARIKAIRRGTQSVRVHPTEVDCYYQVIAAPDGSTLLHLSTFGSSERQSEPKSSQSIQLDETSAAELVSLIRSTFPRLGE
jgi:hypothetical protein